MDKNKIVSFEDWKDDHDLLYGVGILGNGYLEATAQNAMIKRGMKRTVDQVQVFQLYNNLVDSNSNNYGVIDVQTFIALVEVFLDEGEEEIYNTIMYHLNESMNKYIEAVKPKKNIFQKLKDIFIKKRT